MAGSITDPNFLKKDLVKEMGKDSDNPDKAKSFVDKVGGVLDSRLVKFSNPEARGAIQVAKGLSKFSQIFNK